MIHRPRPLAALAASLVPQKVLAIPSMHRWPAASRSRSSRGGHHVWQPAPPMSGRHGIASSAIFVPNSAWQRFIVVFIPVPIYQVGCSLAPCPKNRHHLNHPAWACFPREPTTLPGKQDDRRVAPQRSTQPGCAVGKGAAALRGINHATKNTVMAVTNLTDEQLSVVKLPSFKGVETRGRVNPTGGPRRNARFRPTSLARRS